MRQILRAIARSRRLARHTFEVVQQLLPQAESAVAEDAASYWSASESSPAARDLSHWLGEGRWSDEAAWSRIGQLHFEMFENLCLVAGVVRPVGSMLEWGPGGGANAVCFCGEVRDFYGVDISPANLHECQRLLEARGFAGFRPVLVDIGCPEQCLEVIESPVDFFLSTAVYQHFPSKEHGVRVTRVANRVLVEGGVALIQIRYDDGSRRFAPKRRDYSKNVITFTSYGIVEFWQITVESGFVPLGMTLDPSVSYAYYYLKKGAG